MNYVNETVEERKRTKRRETKKNEQEVSCEVFSNWIDIRHFEAIQIICFHINLSHKFWLISIGRREGGRILISQVDILSSVPRNICVFN